MVEYEQRDMALLAMGFTSYAAYLDSHVWKRIRDRALKKCATSVCCGEAASEVHHRNYEQATLRGDDMSGLAPLCPTCHDLAEFDLDGHKVSLQDANRTVDLLASLKRAAEPHSTRPTHHEEPQRVSRPKNREKSPSKRQMILATIPAALLPPIQPAAPKKKRTSGRRPLIQRGP